MLSTGRVLITGATGFVGSAVARTFLGAGYVVRALVRVTSPRTNLTGLDIELVEGDIRDSESVARAMQEVRYVLHVAADYRLWAPEPEEIIRTNVSGTRTVMEAARRAGVERIVYTSSAATLRLRLGGDAADETESATESEALGPYKRSKVAAERLVAEMVARDGLPAVIVNPTAPIGRRDIKPTPTGRVIVEAACGRMPGYVDTGLNLVDVDDVAAGHLAALVRGRVGDRYILGGQNVMLADMLQDIARLVGRRPPSLRLPRGLIYPVALAAEAMAKLTRREPFVTIEGLRLAKHRMFFTSAKAERELGYRARPYIEALRDAIDWFRQAGYLARRRPSRSR